MLSFGSAAYRADKTVVATYSATLATPPGAVTDDRTMKWWATRPEAWERARRDARPPEIVMPEYASWLEALPGRPVFVGYPAAFDFLYVYWYLMRFAGRSPFSHSALDIKTLAMSMLGCGYRDAVKRNMPLGVVRRSAPHARGTRRRPRPGALFCNLLAAIRTAADRRER